MKILIFGIFGLLIFLRISQCEIVQKNNLESSSNASTNNTYDLNVVEENDVDDDVIYVCGKEKNTSDARCICQYESLICNRYFRGYQFLAKLEHLNIKIADDTFTAKTVDFKYNEFDTIKKNEILPGHESKVKTLILESCNIKSIEDGTFDSFKSLATLNLESNALKNITDKIFTKEIGASLTYLNLEHNSLQNLSTTVFQHLSNLTVLSLKGNTKINLFESVNGINVTVFPEALANLGMLNLDNCGIRYLDENVFVNLKKLQHLLLSQNSLGLVPSAIKKLPNLAYLTLESTYLESINNCDFCGLQNLQYLFFDDSRTLSYIHENAFGAISNAEKIPDIKYLSLRNCHIQTLPEKLLHWQNVSYIAIANNPIRCNCSMAWLINDFNASVPLYVNNFKGHEPNSNANDLVCHYPSELAGTHMHTLAGEFCAKKSSEIMPLEDSIYNVCGEEGNRKISCSCYGKALDCDYPYWSSNKNKLNHTNLNILKPNFTVETGEFRYNNLTSLQKGKILPGYEASVTSLIFIRNEISFIGNGTFENFESLTRLYLGYNKLSNLSDYEYHIFPSNLTLLSLSSNNISSLPTVIFENLLNLTFLDVSNNPRISTSAMHFPKSLATLKTLDISSCNITALEENAFEYLTSLETLSLGSNPFTSIPTAINSLATLQQLDLFAMKITSLSNQGLKVNKNLKILNAYYSELQRIEDCAFCSFPNLTTVDLRSNHELSYIHENAFGIKDKATPKVDTFNIQFCNISTLSEKLLNWRNVSSIKLAYNAFECNCSMAWLINDYKAAKPKYINNLKSWGWYNKYSLYCTGPQELKNTYFHTLSGDFCKDELFDYDQTYHVCGDEIFGDEIEIDTSCTCDGRNLKCDAVKNANIQIMNKTIQIQNANIFNGNITILNLTNFLPEHQRQITTFTFFQSNISAIVPRTFDNFTSLKTLDFTSNNLTQINGTVLTAKLGETLEELILSSNSLKVLTQKTFSNLKELKTLRFSENPQLRKFFVRDIFLGLEKLETLDLSNCNISMLNEDSFYFLTNLTFLNLRFNPLNSMPSAINGLPSLQTLDISHSGIAVLSNAGIKEHKSLQNIYAQFSKIERIEDCAFCSFPNLMELDLDQNARLSVIHENAFGFAQNVTKGVKVKEFLLTSCNLTTVPQKLLPWNSVKKLRASFNPFACDCDLEWFIKSFRTHHGYMLSHGYTCHSPPQFLGQTFYEISESYCNVTSTTTTTTTTAILVTDSEATDSKQNLWIILSLSFLIALIGFGASLFGVFLYRRRHPLQNIQLLLDNDNYNEEENGGEGGNNAEEEDFDPINV